MSVLYVALPVAILMGASALIACVRCIRSGQFDDLETPALRMLIDDPAIPASAESKAETRPSAASSSSASAADVG